MDKRSHLPLQRMLVLLSLAIPGALTIAPFLLSHKLLLMRDLYLQWTPWQIHYADCIRGGVLPLWNPWQGAGEPFLADTQTATLYPFSVLFVMLPMPASTFASIFLHLMIASGGCYLLCRQFGLSRGSSLFSAYAYCLGTNLITRIEFFAFFTSTAWVPVIWASFFACVRQVSIRRVVGLALLLSLQLLAGYPEALVYNGICMALYALALSSLLWWKGEARMAPLRPLFLLLSAHIIGALLCMAQILPAWEALGRSYRASFDPELYKASASLATLGYLIFPFIYGTPGHLGRAWAPNLYEYWVGALYIGALPVITVVTASITFIRVQAVKQYSRNQPLADTRLAVLPGVTKGALPSRFTESMEQLRLPFLIGLCVFTFAYGMGQNTFLFKFLWNTVPMLQKFRWPTKMFAEFSLAASILAGISLDYLRCIGRRKPMALMDTVWVCLPGLVIALIAALFFVGQGIGGRAVLNVFYNLGSVPRELVGRIEWHVLSQQLMKLAVVSSFGGLFLLLWSRSERFHVFASVLLLSTSACDLYITDRVLLPTGDLSLLDQNQEFSASARKQAAGARILEANPLTQFWSYGVRDESLMHQARCAWSGLWATADKVNSLTQKCSFLPSDLAAVLGLYYSDKVPPETKQRLLQRINCGAVIHFTDMPRYLATGIQDPPIIESVTDPMPRCYVVGQIQTCYDMKELLRVFTSADYDPHTSALGLLNDIPAGMVPKYTDSPIEHNIMAANYRNEDVSITVDSSSEGYLVLLDTWYPGWNASVNGQATPIMRVNGAFRAVHIPKGTSEVQMRYRPWTFYAGAVVSVITLIVCGACCLWKWRQTIQIG